MTSAREKDRIVAHRRQEPSCPETCQLFSECILSRATPGHRACTIEDMRRPKVGDGARRAWCGPDATVPHQYDVTWFGLTNRPPGHHVPADVEVIESTLTRASRAQSRERGDPVMRSAM